MFIKATLYLIFTDCLYLSDATQVYFLMSPSRLEKNIFDIDHYYC